MLKGDEGVHAVAVTPSGAIVSGGADGFVKLFST